VEKSRGIVGRAAVDGETRTGSHPVWDANPSISRKLSHLRSINPRSLYRRNVYLL
jgi:hypothetical protein